MQSIKWQWKDDCVWEELETWIFYEKRQSSLISSCMHLHDLCWLLQRPCFLLPVFIEHFALTRVALNRLLRQIWLDFNLDTVFSFLLCRCETTKLSVSDCKMSPSIISPAVCSFVWSLWRQQVAGEARENVGLTSRRASAVTWLTRKSTNPGSDM